MFISERISILQEYITAKCPESSHSKLKSFCATRWVQRHESINIFLELFSAVATALQTMTETGNRETTQKAATHFSAICCGKFIFAILCMKRASSLLLPLAKQLQSQSIENVKALDLEQT